MNGLYGLQIRESLFAVTVGPTRLHKKRGNQSAAYHARIQKKWTKRFGTKSTPCAYKIRDPLTGAQVLVVHPSVMTKIRDGGLT